MRVMDERLSALRQHSQGEKARNAFLEKNGSEVPADNRFIRREPR